MSCIQLFVKVFDFLFWPNTSSMIDPSFSIKSESRRVDFLTCFSKLQKYLVGFSPYIFNLGKALLALFRSYLSISLSYLFLVVASIQLIFEFPPPPQNPRTSLVGPVIAGGGIGWLSGVFGIGGGIFSVPYFYHRGLKMMNAIGTSAACGIPIALAGSISYIVIGYDSVYLPNNSVGFVYLPATIIVGIMSSITAKYGVNIAHRMKQKKLRIAFAFLVMIMALNLLMRYDYGIHV